MLVGYQPREYHLVKVSRGKGFCYLVLSPDLTDPDIWVLINICESAQEGWAYVREVEARARQMVGAV